MSPDMFPDMPLDVPVCMPFDMPVSNTKKPTPGSATSDGIRAMKPESPGMDQESPQHNSPGPQPGHEAAIWQSLCQLIIELVRLPFRALHLLVELLSEAGIALARHLLSLQVLIFKGFACLAGLYVLRYVAAGGSPRSAVAAIFRDIASVFIHLDKELSQRGASPRVLEISRTLAHDAVVTSYHVCIAMGSNQLICAMREGLNFAQSSL